jgi:methyl-accepting chemotaxis protein
MRTRLALSLVALALGLAAAGCGGSDDEADPTAAWASGFCSAVTGWTDALQDVTSQFSDTSNLSQDGLESAAGDVKESTQQLVDDIRALGAPETDGGEEIRSTLDTLSTTLETEADEIEAAVEGISGITGLPSAISTVTASLSAMGTAFSEALQAIGQADVGGELQSALEDSPECAGISSG